jgi:hypothetical protein
VTREVAGMTYPQWSIAYTAVTGNDAFTGHTVKDLNYWLNGKVPATRIPTLIREAIDKKPGWQNRIISFVAGIKTVELDPNWNGKHVGSGSGG